MAKKFLSSLRLVNHSTNPGSANAGELYYNTVDNAVKVYNGTAWASIASGGSALPSQTGNSGEFLTTDGTSSSWGTVSSAIIAWQAYDAEVDLPAAAGVHGMFAHVHGTGSAYYAHAGSWVKLLDAPTAATTYAALGSANTFTANQTVSGTLTATSFVKTGGTSSQFLKANGTVDSSVYLTLADTTAADLYLYSSTEMTPLDSLKLEFDGIQNRFVPKYQGQQVSVGNPYRVEILLNGVQQPLDFPEYVWGTPFMSDGFTIDYDGYIAFSEVPPAGATFSGKIVAGSPTSTVHNRYPFRAADILLGAY
jgi:hypothetical protein